MRKRTLAFGALALGLVALLIFAKPLRMAAPPLFGLHCEGPVCVEDPKDASEAKALYRDALNHIGEHVKPLKADPRFIFCRTQSCYQRFGGGQERAISYPYLGTIIAPQSWQAYIVKHELVHCLQFQEYGAYQTMEKPVWLREGMAYALSGAPESDIPEAHMPLVRQYETWQQGKSAQQIWDADACCD